MRTTLLTIGVGMAMLVATGCDAFRTLTSPKPTSQGAPYELILVCGQANWDGALGDTLRTILTAPIPYLNQKEPLFDLYRVNERGYTNIVTQHRNILKVLISPSVSEPSVAVEYDPIAAPQIVMTLQGPSAQSVTDYISANRESLVAVLEKTERDRDINFGTKFTVSGLNKSIKEKFGVEMSVPKGYNLRSVSDDFIWISQEYPTSSQGFFIYSYPYNGAESLSLNSLLAARNKYAAKIPGPSDGSYMTTYSDPEAGYKPDYTTFRMQGRLWVELRGFWDVAGDYMGGPFVSYSTVDLKTNRVFTIDCYIFSPKAHKRNFMRGVEHLLYLIDFPDADSASQSESTK